MTEEVQYTIRIRNEGADGFWAEVVELPGCFATGFTFDELKEALAEAISLYLSSPGCRKHFVFRDFEPSEASEVRVLMSV